MQTQHQGRRVLALTLLLAVAGAAAAVELVQPDTMSGRGLLPWWVLAPAFALADVLVVPIGRRRSRMTLPLTAAPLVLGLFLATPVDLLSGRVIGATAVAVLWRDRPALRIGLDAALVAAGTAAAQAVFATLLVGTGSDGPIWGAVAGVLGACVAGLLDTSVVLLVAGWYEGRTRGVDAARLLLVSLAGSAAAGMVGLVGVTLIKGAAVGLPLALACAAVLITQRAYTSQSEWHRNLQRLHELSDALAAAPASSDVVALMLVQSIELIEARYAEASLAELDGREQPSCWVLRAGERLEGPRSPVLPAVDSLPAVPSTHLVVRPRSEAERAFLAARGLSEAVVVPLRRDGGVDGFLIVGDRAEPTGNAVDADGRLMETVANHASVALRNRRLIHQLYVEARHDDLTGLPNRVALRELLDRTALAAADGGQAVSVMVLDFDGFKAINDTLGHQAGDELLRVLSGRLAEAAGADATVARLGGDEFAVLSTRFADAGRSVQLARRLLSVFESPVTVAGARLRLGGSLGIALGPEHGASGSDLLRNADIAMYAAKGAGGGLRMYSADQVELTASGLTLATDLRDAIEQQQISVAVQPLVELATGALHSVEVLARWHHPELGEVPPEQFFAAAERSGQVQALSACVLDRALALSREWQGLGLQVRVAVNLATRWLADPSLPDQVGGALARHGVAAGMLCLEITERGVIADPKHTTQTLSRLRAMGVHLSVDDFGTGYSSLTYLSRLPVDQMKIDKSFVEELDAHPRDRAIVRSMIDLGRNLGLEVVAEGVMTPAAREVLQELGCRLGQGYLIARPLSPAELPGYLGAHAGAAPAGVPAPSPAQDDAALGWPACPTT
jgi:diguanylate cyclase (GGDEF)-like protein